MAAVPAPTATPGQIPSPFGQPAPQPQAPPDPRRDPFAQQAQRQAANLAAYYGIGQALPGSAEGVSAEPISQPKPWGRIGLLAGAALVVFGVGNACGRITAARVNFNQTIDQSAQIRDEVEHMGKRLNDIADKINQSKETMKGNVDLELSKALGELDLKKPDTQKIFHTNYFFLEDIAIERLFGYYNDTIQLYDEIAKHAKKTEDDKDSIKSFMTNAAGKADKNYGVTLDLSGAIPLAHFVEIGAPVCPKEGQTDCQAGELKGFKYRMDLGSAWSERPVKGKPGETVTPIQATPFFKSVAAGSPDILAVKDYARRIGSIRALAQKLMAEQKDVLGDLKRSSDRPKVFTF
jgi:hypothetical protein